MRILFAKINSDNIVTQVVETEEEDCYDEDNCVCESVATERFDLVFPDGESHTWKKLPHGVDVGCRYDPENDQWILPQPYPSWTFDKTGFGQWVPPVEQPDPPGSDDDPTYIALYWNEDTQEWIKEYQEIPEEDPEAGVTS
jgi:hypothetical protein